LTDPRGPLDFDDGGGRRRERPADARRDDDARPEQPGRPPRSPAWFVGVVAVIFLLYIGVNTLRNQGEGPGAKGPEIGSQARGFVAPYAVSGIDKAVNVATKPDQGDAGKRPACTVHLPGAFNLCDLWDSGPVVIVFFVSGSSRCVEQLDTLQSVLARHRDVGAVAVAIRGKLSKAAEVAREHGYTFPVVYDADGRLANLYGMAVCPQLTYLRKGGEVAGTNVGSIGADGLDAQLRALESGAADVTAG